jgi:polar amino acid transport system permease protein
MRRSQQIASTTFKPVEVYLIAGAIYLAVNLLLAQVGRRMERHMTIAGAQA